MTSGRLHYWTGRILLTGSKNKLKGTIFSIIDIFSEYCCFASHGRFWVYGESFSIFTNLNTTEICTPAGNVT